jgi:hypothetical protein
MLKAGNERECVCVRYNKFIELVKLRNTHKHAHARLQTCDSDE